MKKVCIYKITSPTSRVYIGQTRNFHQRMKFYEQLHCKGQPKLYQSLCKYGYENHLVDILANFSINSSKCSLDELEQEYINIYKKGHKMLNLSYAGVTDGFHCDTTRKKIGKSQIGRIPWNKGRKQTEAERLVNSLSHMGIVNRAGFKVSDEIKAKISKSLKGRKITDPVVLENMRKASTGRVMSAETRAKISLASMGNQKGLGKVCSIEKRLKISNGQKGKKQPSTLGELNPAKREDVREKIRLSKILYWQHRKNGTN